MDTKRKHTPTILFIELWNNSGSAGEVADIVGRPVETVRRRASNLRRHGYHLKSMRHDLDVAALTELVKNPPAPDSSQASFVLVWERSQSLKEVMRHTGLSKDAVRTRARVMRQAGVPLKRLRKPRVVNIFRVSPDQLTAKRLTVTYYRGKQ